MRQAREAWCIAGRRAGKSRIASLVAVYLAAFRDYRDVLAIGEIGTLPVIASDRRQARTVMSYITGLLDEVPMLAALVVSRTAESIELSTGVRIEIHTASWRALRGYTVVGAVLDEICFWRSEDSANPDAEIVNALRPAMVTVPNALLVAISSLRPPRDRLGDASPAPRPAGGSRHPDVAGREPGHERVHPRGDRRRGAGAGRAVRAGRVVGRVAPRHRGVPLARGARRRDDAGGAGPAAAARPGLRGVRRSERGASDAFTLGIAHAERDGDQVRAVLDHLAARRPPFSPEATVEEFCAPLKAYRVDHVVGDRYGGEWPPEQFRKHGVSYECSAVPKSDLYREALPLLTSGRARLLDDPHLLRELLGLERKTARGGRDSIDHGPGGHDDSANSACGALVRAAASAGSGDFVLAANLAPAPRGRILDEGEFALLGRL